MRQLAHLLPALPGIDSPKTYAAWPVWSGSTTDEVKWPKLIKAAVIDWYHRARRWNAAKEIAGRYGGTLGSAALRVLECLMFDFQNYKTGRLDPSYEGIAAKTGLGRSTVAVALARLRQFGLIHWLQRSAHHWIDGKFQLKQITNAYALLPPSQWRGIDLPPEPPPPEAGTWGDHPPMPSAIEQAIIEKNASLRPCSRVSAVASARRRKNRPTREIFTGVHRLLRSRGSGCRVWISSSYRWLEVAFRKGSQPDLLTGGRGRVLGTLAATPRRLGPLR